MNKLSAEERAKVLQLLCEGIVAIVEAADRKPNRPATYRKRLAA